MNRRGFIVAAGAAVFGIAHRRRRFEERARELAHVSPPSYLPPNAVHSTDFAIEYDFRGHRYVVTPLEPGQVVHPWSGARRVTAVECQQAWDAYLARLQTISDAHVREYLAPMMRRLA